jgi:hypothetical protein
MTTLTVYVDRSARSELAKTQLDGYGILYDVVDVETTPSAVEFLASQGRDRKHFSMPQYYVGNTLAFEGFKEVNFLTKEQINSKIKEINDATI